MVRILLVGGNSSSLDEFAKFLSSKNSTSLSYTDSAQEALAIIDREKIDTVVVDEQLVTGNGLSFVRQLMKIDPLLNCALISSLSLADFHEATEGMGVFMQLPTNPGPPHAEKMLQLLESIEVLMNL